MRLQLISDLHLEFHKGRALAIVESLPVEKGLDFLVVAGDTVVPKAMGLPVCGAVWAALAQMARHVLTVHGNHEYYGKATKQWLDLSMAAIFASHPSIHWLDNRELVLDGVKFVGGTMWYPVGDGNNGAYKRMVSDCYQIADFNWAERENAVFNIVVNTHADRDTIVVTHHLPHRMATPREFVGDQSNRFFVSDQSHTMMVRRPKLWLFGHTHTPYDGWYEDTHLACNPYGYSSERAGKPYPPVVFDV